MALTIVMMFKINRLVSASPRAAVVAPAGESAGE
jgi:hypothetical protein